MRLLPPRAAALGLALAFASHASAQTTTLVTHGISAQADGGSLYPEISADGRWIVFQSSASNLVPGDTNDKADVFRFDTQTGTFARLSVSTAGVEGNGDCLDPAFSLDGNVVAFFAYASNLVPGDTNGLSDIYVHDIAAGTTVLASVGPGGVLSNGISRYPALSGDGRLVAFESTATNLVAGDTNGVRDLFVHDLQTGVTIRASVSATGQEADGQTLDAFLSPDGRYVAFESTATNLVPGDTNGMSDVFVKDLMTDAIVRVSTDSSGAEGNRPSRDPSLSDLAGIVCFSSEASNLVPGDANGYEDVFVHTMATGITERVSISTAGAQAHIGAYESMISSDGLFVTYYSRAGNLVPGDTNSSMDVFLRDNIAGTTERVSVGSNGQQGDGDSVYPAVTPGGRYVVFDSTSETLVAGDTNLQRDIFIHDRYSPSGYYCESAPNSVSDGALMGLNGSNSIAASNLRLQATDCPPNQFGVFYYGLDQIQIPFGDGFRCVGGAQVYRLPVVSTGPSGVPSHLVDYANPPQPGGQITAGSTWNFQFWYRDPTGPGGSGFNLTDGLELTFGI
jgi:Tol biopolymer transport system component